MMIRVLSPSFRAALLAVVCLFAAGPALAEEDSDVADRIGRMEEQIRQLVGQVEELSFELRETRSELRRLKLARAGDDGAKKKPFEDEVTGEAEDKPPKKKIARRSSEEITDTPESAAAASGEELAGDIIDENGETKPLKIKKSPPPKVLGILPGSTGDLETGGDVGDDAGKPAEVKTVSLGSDEALDTPEKLYERSYESLLRRQFSDAESGFRAFLERHREHSLAGNAQYWLGETFYVQGEYKTAAQFFLVGFEEFPKGRKAADSLVKLGMSLNRLGQKEQACAAFAAVPDKFPKATEAKKRASAELKRGKC